MENRAQECVRKPIVASPEEKNARPKRFRKVAAHFYVTAMTSFLGVMRCPAAWDSWVAHEI